MLHLENGFLLPNIVKERILSYSLTEFSKANSNEIIKLIKN